MVKKAFTACRSKEEIYKKVMEMGRKLPPLPEEHKTDVNLVRGCQSRMYLHSTFQDGKMHYAAEADALISSGLAALLIAVYDDEPPEALLKCPPDYLTAIGIASSLTPNRANGLFSLHLRMQQEALAIFAAK